MINAIIIAIYVIAALTAIIVFGKWVFFLILAILSIPGTFVLFNTLCIKYPLAAPLVGVLAWALSYLFARIAVKCAKNK